MINKNFRMHGCKSCFKKLNILQNEQIKEDEIRTQELIDNDYKVIRLWGHDINKMNKLETFQNKIN